MSKKKTAKTSKPATPKQPAKSGGDTTTLAQLFPAKVTTGGKPAIPMIAGLGAKQKAKRGTGKDGVAITATQSAKSVTGMARGGPRKMSGLDAAAKVLSDAGKPLTSQEIVEAMTSKGLWKTSGKTPHATIYAAMIREIAKKGSAGRFRKTDRGHFTVAKTK